jgi:hypothetical protein
MKMLNMTEALNMLVENREIDLRNDLDETKQIII